MSNPRPLASKVCDLYQQGFNQEQIASLLKTSIEVTRHLMRQGGLMPRLPTGVEKPQWRGKNASYSAFHKRVTTLRGQPKRCEVCGSENPDSIYNWANLTGNYSDSNDYRRMCFHCHTKFDKERRAIRKAVHLAKIHVAPGQVWKSRHGRLFTVLRVDLKYAHYWLEAGSRPQYKAIALDNLKRLYKLHSDVAATTIEGHQALANEKVAD